MISSCPRGSKQVSNHPSWPHSKKICCSPAIGNKSGKWQGKRIIDELRVCCSSHCFVNATKWRELRNCRQRFASTRNCWRCVVWLYQVFWLVHGEFEIQAAIGVKCCGSPLPGMAELNRQHRAMPSTFLVCTPNPTMRLDVIHDDKYPMALQENGFTST